MSTKPPPSMTETQMSELISIISKYLDDLRADECEPEVPTDLWMDLADWAFRLDETKGKP